MKYPWIAEALIDWEIDPCKHKGREIDCDKCALKGELCEKLLEVATIIADKITGREEW